MGCLICDSGANALNPGTVLVAAHPRNFGNRRMAGSEDGMAGSEEWREARHVQGTRNQEITTRKTLEPNKRGNRCTEGLTTCCQDGQDHECAGPHHYPPRLPHLRSLVGRGRYILDEATACTGGGCTVPAPPKKKVRIHPRTSEITGIELQTARALRGKGMIFRARAQSARSEEACCESSECSARCHRHLSVATQPRASATALRPVAMRTLEMRPLGPTPPQRVQWR